MAILFSLLPLSVSGDDLSPDQLRSYVGILLADRIAYMKQVDDLRLQLETARGACAK